MNSIYLRIERRNGMEEKTIHRIEQDTTKKYLVLMDTITRMENRLKWSELTYLSLDIVVLLFTVIFTHSIIGRNGYLLTHVDLALVFSCIIVGLSINAYWLASGMRAQLKLKLKYFQARALERMINKPGEFLFSDESLFFDRKINGLESPDGKEILRYPTSGLTRMDGFIGSAKPRYFTIFLPLLFVVIYWFIFFVILSRI